MPRDLSNIDDVSALALKHADNLLTPCTPAQRARIFDRADYKQGIRAFGDIVEANRALKRDGLDHATHLESVVKPAAEMLWELVIDLRKQTL